MKKTGLLNAPLSDAVSRMGHTDGLVICDSGLPIPPDSSRIDLAVVPGVPSFLQVVEAVGQELQVERALIAAELPERNPTVFHALTALLEKIGAAQGAPIPVERVPHEDFKRRTTAAKAIVRTGECTPFANVILYSGVFF